MASPSRVTNITGRFKTRWRRAGLEIRRRLTWSRLYRMTSYARSALWIVPFLSILAVLISVPVIRVLDAWLEWDMVSLGVEGSKSMYQTVLTLNMSFLIFTFGSMLVAIQIAGGQLTPRVIATTLLRDNVVRYSVGLFVYALLFSTMALNRMEDKVHDLATSITGLLGVATIVVFLFLIDYAARLLRPVSILARVAEGGLQVIATVYPDPVAGDADESSTLDGVRDGPTRVVPHTGRSEIVLAVDLETVIREAQMASGVVEFIPHVGDFLATDQPLFALYGGATEIDDHTLREAVAFGPERTLEQDPLFAFRIMVDIALKALSPAINDPTTGTLAIDQIHRLLRVVGRRRLRGKIVADGLGEPRVIYRTPNWEDFIHLSCTEIRHCGANNVQIARRLRSMFDNLLVALPPHRHRAVKDERDRLDQALKALYPIPADLALASAPDPQGIGGSRRPRAQ
jgi:uncharacterized membrane protein